MDPRVDGFLAGAERWKDEFTRLRSIILDCGLDEGFKWGQPCYSFQDKNIVLIHGFRDYCAVLFMKGALLQDAGGILITQTENVQASRQIRFTGIQDIAKVETLLRAYIQEAVEAEKAGLKVEFKETREFPVPEELRLRLEADPALQTAFAALTPGRQRAYLLHFAEPKQSTTRQAQIEKHIPKILDGKGLNDR